MHEEIHNRAGHPREGVYFACSWRLHVYFPSFSDKMSRKCSECPGAVARTVRSAAWGGLSCNVVTSRCRGRHTDREAPPIPPPRRRPRARRLWCLATRCSNLLDPPPASVPAGPPADPLAGPPISPPASPPTSPFVYHLPRHQEALGWLPQSAKPILSHIHSLNGRCMPQSHQKVRGWCLPLAKPISSRVRT